MTRLFVAVWPPQDVVDELTTLRRKDHRGVRFVPPENWHLTLRFLGEAGIGEVIGALERVDLPRAHVELGPALDMLGRHSVVIPAIGLEELASTVVERTRDLGTHPPDRFAGHLTVARLARRAPLPAILGTRFDAAFDVKEIALVRSRLEPAGARYETIETWPVGQPSERDR